MTDLDDFFAKKDKKRGKNKSKASALSAEALVRELEEGSAKSNEYPVNKGIKTAAALEILGLDSNDADWKDFEEVERRDYTGLKVKEMSLQDQTDEEQRRLEQAEAVPESTPWKIKEETTSAITADNSTATKQNKLLQEAESGASNTKSSDTDKSVSSSLPSAATSDQQQQQQQQQNEKSESESQEAGAAGGSSDVLENKDGDSKPKPSAKKEAYKPPGERNAEVRQLDPIKGASLKNSLRGKGGSQQIDISDVNSFPSLG